MLSNDGTTKKLARRTLLLTPRFSEVGGMSGEESNRFSGFRYRKRSTRAQLDAHGSQRKDAKTRRRNEKRSLASLRLCVFALSPPGALTVISNRILSCHDSVFCLCLLKVQWCSWAWKWVAGLLAPLALIWFPDEIGSLTGYFQSGYVNVQTPGPIISFIGWFLLVAPGVVCLCFVLR